MKTMRMFVVIFTVILILAGLGKMWHIVSDNRYFWTGFDKSYLFGAYCATVGAFGLIISWLFYELHVLHKKLGILEEDESREKKQKQDIFV